jgi:adenine deaminase
MTTDGPAPEFVAENCLVDGLLRVAVENGVPLLQTLQMVTPATLFRIDGRVGGLGVDFLPALRLRPLGLLDAKSAEVLIPAEHLARPERS